MSEKSEKNIKNGIYWTSLGGNNPDELSGNCHLYSAVTTNDKGEEKTDNIIVDAGSFDIIEKFGVGGLENVVPDTLPYLEKEDGPENKDKAAAIFLTHAHRDHIGAIPEYIKMGYKLPKIYAAPYTREMVKCTLASHKIPLEKWPEFETFESGQSITIGNAKIEAVAVSHSVPDALAFKIRTPDAKIFHTGDFKMDQTMPIGKSTDIKKIEEMAKDGFDAMMIDSTAAKKPGYARNEAEIGETYKKLIKEASKGQVIVASAPHHLNRIASIAKAAAESGRSVIIDGGSNQRFHLRGLKNAGYDLEKEIKGLKIIDGKSKEAKELPPEKKLVITSAGYGQKEATLYKAAHDNHDGFKIEKGDTVIIETSGSQWTETVLEGIKEPLKEKGVNIMTGIDEPNIYGSGHGQRQDIIELHKKVNPHVTVPVHCNDKIRDKFIEIAKEENINTGGIVPKNGMTLKTTSARGTIVHDNRQAEWIGVRPVSENKSEPVRLPQKITKALLKKIEKKYKRQALRSVAARKKIKELKAKKQQKPIEPRILDHLYEGR